MRHSIQVIGHDSRTVSVSDHTDKCPICHHGISPIFVYGVGSLSQNRVELVFACPRSKCHKLFISEYFGMTPEFGNLEYVVSKPQEFVSKEFSEVINTISPSFCIIYNQAYKTEQSGLDQICGVGYRKAIEFLIKDYAIYKNPEKQEEIKSKDLAKCINEFIESKMIKEIAERAAWLGNDETHYLRKWIEKDINDLKKLINMTVSLFEMETSHVEILSDMPNGKNNINN